MTQRPLPLCRNYFDFGVIDRDLDTEIDRIILCAARARNFGYLSVCSLSKIYIYTFDFFSDNTTHWLF